jgi:hypothetical protein
VFTVSEGAITVWVNHTARQDATLRLSCHARLLCGVNRGVKVQACLIEDLTVKRNDLTGAVAHLKNNMKANEYEGHDSEAHGAGAVCSVLLSPSGSKDGKIGGLYQSHYGNRQLGSNKMVLHVCRLRRMAGGPISHMQVTNSSDQIQESCICGSTATSMKTTLPTII